MDIHPAASTGYKRTRDTSPIMVKHALNSLSATSGYQIMAFLISVHVLFVVIWVGGMFFAYMALRPAAARTLEPSQRLPLWAATFSHFFPWVWLSVLLILVTGLILIVKYFGGMAGSGLYIHIMLGLGILMMLIYMHVFFAPYNRLKKAVEKQDWATGGKALNQIRMLIGINLSIGIITVLIATAGKYLLH